VFVCGTEVTNDKVVDTWDELPDGVGIEKDEGVVDAREVEVGWVSESVGTLLTCCVESREEFDGCWPCDCDVTEVVDNCEEFWRDVGGFCVDSGCEVTESDGDADEVELFCPADGGS
jgi:hypothetical protein